MPDKDGNVKGIHIPRVPWHEVTEAYGRGERRTYVDGKLLHVTDDPRKPKPRDELATQRKMLEAWKREQGTSGVGWPE